MGTVTLYDAQGNEFQVELDDEDATAVGQQSDPKQRTNSEWAQLRRAEKQAKDNEARATEAAKQVAFMRAGIDPEDTRMSYFVKGYTGEADPSAIKSAAVAAGFLTADAGDQQTAQGQTLSDQQQAAVTASAAISAANPGAGPDVSTPVQRLEQAYAQGGMPAMIDQAVKEGIVLAPNQMG